MPMYACRSVAAEAGRDHAAAAGARRKAAEECGDDRAGRGGRVADVKREESGPADFVDETGEPRAGVREQEQQGHEIGQFTRRDGSPPRRPRLAGRSMHRPFDGIGHSHLVYHFLGLPIRTHAP